MKLLNTGALTASLALLTWLVGSTQTTAQENGALAGNAARGEPLFADAYNCYACHGFDAQSGDPALVPLKYTQQGFITFVQNSPLPQMPAFPDAPAQDLADIYAYIQSIPADAPDVSDVPLLDDIRMRKQRTLTDTAARP